MRKGFREVNFMKKLKKDIVSQASDYVKDEMNMTRDRINNAIDQDGPYTHNMISLALRKLAENTGTKYANELVKELDLDDLYGISEIKD
jgi:hypothetical protein